MSLMYYWKSKAPTRMNPLLSSTKVDSEASLLSTIFSVSAFLNSNWQRPSFAVSGQKFFKNVPVGFNMRVQLYATCEAHSTLLRHSSDGQSASASEQLSSTIYTRSNK
jgi:hypothetical protein